MENDAHFSVEPEVPPEAYLQFATVRKSALGYGGRSNPSPAAVTKIVLGRLPSGKLYSLRGQEDQMVDIILADAVAEGGVGKHHSGIL